MQTAAIQQELMDAALTCGDQARTDFNAFQTSFNAELRRSDKTLLAMFRRVMGGSKGDAAYNLFKTDMASKAELRRVHGHADFCAAANLVISAALAPDKPSLNDFVAGVPVTDVAASAESPVGSCQVQVAVTLQGAMVSPAVLPRPNPLRVAVAEHLRHRPLRRLQAMPRGAAMPSSAAPLSAGGAPSYGTAEGRAQETRNPRAGSQIFFNRRSARRRDRAHFAAKGQNKKGGPNGPPFPYLHRVGLSATQIDNRTAVLRLAHARTRRNERIVEALAFDRDAIAAQPFADHFVLDGLCTTD